MRIPLAAVALCALVAGCGGGDSTGPLEWNVDGGSDTGGTARIGQFFDIGLALPENGSDDVAVLRRVEPEDPARARGLELRFAVTECRLGSARGWPPAWCKRGFTPVEGHRVEPGKRTLIVVGARASRPGRWHIPEFRVEYTVGNRRYSSVYHQGLCVRVSQTDGPDHCLD